MVAGYVSAYLSVLAQENIARDLRTRGRRMDLFFYEAGHAFMREEDAEAYDAEAATLAWTRAIEFLKTELR